MAAADESQTNFSEEELADIRLVFNEVRCGGAWARAAPAKGGRRAAC